MSAKCWYGLLLFLTVSMWPTSAAILARENPKGNLPTRLLYSRENGAPFWASTQGLAPDPTRPGYTQAGDQYRGTITAPVAIVAFMNFSEIVSKRHFEETQPTLDEQYISTGKVLWVFKHYPGATGSPAFAASIAAECAGEQGSFWQMHDLLFERQATWTNADPAPIFVDMASELNLDTSVFATCLEDETISERVQSDVDDGASYVRGTPTFMLLYYVDDEYKGSIIPGALPVESYVENLDEILESARPRLPFKAYLPSVLQP